jgi:hypothetical protein
MTAAQVFTQVSPVGFVVDKVALEVVFPLNFYYLEAGKLACRWP